MTEQIKEKDDLNPEKIEEVKELDEETLEEKPVEMPVVVSDEELAEKKTVDKVTVKIPNFAKFQKFVKSLSGLITEIKFRFNKEGLEFCAMDPASVAMVIGKYSSSECSEYEVTGTVDVGVNILNLLALMKRAKASDVLTLVYEKARLSVTFTGNKPRTFNVPVIEMEDKDQKAPSLTYKWIAAVDMSELKESVEDANIVSESLRFKIKGDVVGVEAGDSTSSKYQSFVQAVLDKGEKEKVNVKLSIEYLQRIFKTEWGTTAKLHLGTDYPMMIIYKTDGVDLTYILAPRVDND